MAKIRARGPAIFFLFLWAQLIFSLGLTALRYNLILFAGAEIYLSNLPPGINRFIALADQHCPADASVAYLSTTQYSGHSRVRYALYPRPVFSYLVETAGGDTELPLVEISELAPFLNEREITCLMVDMVQIEGPLSGEQIQFEPSRYLVDLSR